MFDVRFLPGGSPAAQLHFPRQLNTRLTFITFQPFHPHLLKTPRRVYFRQQLTLDHGFLSLNGGYGEGADALTANGSIQNFCPVTSLRH